MSRPSPKARRFVGSILELSVGEPAFGGGFVARAPDGRVIFVRHAITGERVRALVTEETSRFLRADAVEVLEASPDRVTPLCPHSGPGRCGGCDWQHIKLTTQRQLKAQRIRELLHQIARLDLDIAVEAVDGDIEGLSWRTRVEFGVDSAGRAGFRRHRSHEIEPITDCCLATTAVKAPEIGALHWRGTRSIQVSASTDGASRVVAIETKAAAPGTTPPTTGDLVVNHGPRVGSGEITNTVLGHPFRIHAGVFWQVHPGAAQILSKAVLEGAGTLTGATVLDLYCGAGLFTAMLGRAVGAHGRVIGMERDRQACRDARHNTSGLSHVTIVHDEVNATTIGQLGALPNVVVLDPSREGAGPEVIMTLCEMAPNLQTLVYVSCEPSTFARDIRVAEDHGYSLKVLRAFDCFPMTEHVELVGTLRRHDDA